MAGQTVAPGTPMAELSTVLDGGSHDLAHHMGVIDIHLLGNVNDDPEVRAQVMRYAEANITDEAALTSVRLTVAEQAAASLAENQPTYSRVAEIVDAVADIAGQPGPLTPAVYKRSFALLEAVQTHMPGRTYDVPPETDTPPASDSPARQIMRNAGYRIARWMIDGFERTTRTQGNYDRAVRQDDGRRRNEAALEYGLHISDLTTYLIRRSVDVDPDLDQEGIEAVFEDGVHNAYLNQAKYVHRLHNIYPEAGELLQRYSRVQELIGAASRHIDSYTPGAVETLLDLYDEELSGKNAAILHQAVAITAESSRVRVRQERRSWFGRIRYGEPESSPFEQRRALLESRLIDNFDRYLEEQPAFVGRVFELYHREVDGAESPIVAKYAAYMTTATFGEHGRYDPEAFASGMARIRRVGAVKSEVASVISDDAITRVRRHLRTIRGREERAVHSG